jgi:hypothetical protein
MFRTKVPEKNETYCMPTAVSLAVFVTIKQNLNTLYMHFLYGIFSDQQWSSQHTQRLPNDHR